METFDIHSCNLLYCRYRLCIKAVDVLRPSKPDDPGVYITLFDKKKIQKPRGVRGFFAFLSVQIYNFFMSTNKKFLIILLL